ncbi:MAG: hypothetical protein H0T53_13250 [Herpetosiphonaceae bacterium]|nr:hypothetical protein [Herpetosiphonaceae bacterium]
MLPVLFFSIILLGVLAILPHMHPAVVIDEDDGDEPAKLRLKSTRQR